MNKKNYRSPNAESILVKTEEGILLSSTKNSAENAIIDDELDLF